MAKKKNNNGNNKKSKKSELKGKPRKCNLADPKGTQIKACLQRQSHDGMYCRSCPVSKKYSLI